jgi:hypothetical protein
MTAPLCTHLNAAVLTMVNKLLPCGFDITEDEKAAPGTLKELNAHVAKTGRILVWSGASDETIFGSPDINHAFRAWHDWCHWRLQAEMNAVGEYAVYVEQCAHLNTVYPGHPKLGMWMDLLFVEIVEQNAFHERTGHFPANQRAFVDSRMLALRHISFNPLVQASA